MMKRMAVIVMVGLMAAVAAIGGINIPSNGSDGQLYVTNSIQIDLSQAVTGNWDDDNSGNGGVGIYDSNKWAVVFHYTNVYVKIGCTVTFSNHLSRAPVVWLVDGNVTIDGTVSLDGEHHRSPPIRAEGGPGGFRGGMGVRGGIDAGPGYGVGGGRPLWGGGGYGADGAKHDVYPGGYAYGNPSLLPLIGGSGGGGARALYGATVTDGGGAGGGAILVACSDTMSISGSITANGGNGGGGGGSGGGIRVISESLVGNGSLLARGGSGEYGGAVGRIRVERVSSSGTQVITPNPSLVALPSGAEPIIWLPDSAPEVRIVSIGGEDAPDDPIGHNLGEEDVRLLETNSAPVVVETRNVEETSQVIIRVSPLNSDIAEINATVQQVISSDPLVIRWAANVPMALGDTVLQVRVIRP